MKRERNQIIVAPPQPSPKERGQFPSFGGVRGGTVETDNYPSLPSPTDKIINNQKKYYL